MDLPPIDSPDTLPEWVFPWPAFDVDWSHAGLMVIDYQNYSSNPAMGLVRMMRDQLPGMAAYYVDRLGIALPNTRRLIDGFRAAGREVIYTRHGALLPDGRDMIARRRRRDADARTASERPAMWAVGSPEHAILDELAPAPGELVIDKNTSSPFNGTGVDFILRNMGVQTLVIAGMSTDMCVETTARDAADRGYHVIVVEDATAAFDEAHHRAALSSLARVFGQVWKTDQVLAALA